MAAVESPPSMIPERRRRSPDIIDVDSLGDDVTQRPAQRLRVASRPSDVIEILDSDEETEVQAGPSQPRINQSNHRRIFSPPPPRQFTLIPPVPTLPHQYSGLQSLPMRRRPPPHPPIGIVRPSDQPLPFEAHLRWGVNPAEHAQLPPLAAAPPSHHVPTMGLGGALLATNRQAARGRGQGHGHRVPRPPSGRSSWQLPSFRDMLNGDLFVRPEPIQPRSIHEELFADFGDEDEDDAFLALLAASPDDFQFGRQIHISHPGRRMRHFEPDYKPTYTHPAKPAPGFTFDFAPPIDEPPLSNSIIVVDDSPGPSTAAASSTSSHNDDPVTTLVCARCMDLLVTGESSTGEEHTRRRIWALRCGHMLDGKCIEEIMKPNTTVKAAWLPITAGNSTTKGESSATTPQPTQIDKGKGKAAEPSSESYDPLDLFTTVASSIRSRLRPRPQPTSGTGTTPVANPGQLRPIRPLPHRRQPGSRGKGKGKANVPVVEAEHQWKCPVASCARIHTSLLIEGKWVTDDKAGAIAVYV